MNNITFLLGAGASANAMPVTNEIPLHLSFMADYIERNIRSANKERYIEDIKELRINLNEFNTIDNYARVLSQNQTISNGTQLKKLKSILCGLFMFEQLRKKHEIVNQFSNVDNISIERMKRTIDLRYKSFFAKTLDGIKLDDVINIISWNYDMQLEIGLESNLGYNYDELLQSCSIYPHPSYEIKKENEFGINFPEVPKIVKLNGTAGIFLKDNLFHSIYLNQAEEFDERFEVLLDIHKEISRVGQYNSFLKFAWERDEYSNRAISYASQIISRTTTLVVIGYSFPDFNRPVDQKVFSQNSIEEIFVQLPANDFETVKYNMKSSLGRSAEKAVPINNLREFFIPSQFIPKY